CGGNVAAIKPYLVPLCKHQCWRPAAVVVEGVLILRLGQRSLSLFQALSHTIHELIDRLHIRSLLLGLKAHTRVSTSVHHKGSLLSGGVDVVVVCKLPKREKLIPVVLPLIYK